MTPDCENSSDIRQIHILIRSAFAKRRPPKWSAALQDWTTCSSRIRVSKQGGKLGRKPPVDRSPKEESQIVQGGITSGNLAGTRRRYGIPPNLFYRWKDKAEQAIFCCRREESRAQGVCEASREKTSFNCCLQSGDWIPKTRFSFELERTE